MFAEITNNELAAFLREAATYFRGRVTGGEDAAFWANEANAERCEIAADRLSRQLTPMPALTGPGFSKREQT